MDQMIKWLEAQRQAEGLTKMAFIRKLGVSRTMYESMLRGKRQAGRVVRQAVAMAYPHAPLALFLPPALQPAPKKRNTNA